MVLLLSCSVMVTGWPFLMLILLWDCLCSAGKWQCLAVRARPALPNVRDCFSLSSHRISTYLINVHFILSLSILTNSFLKNMEIFNPVGIYSGVGMGQRCTASSRGHDHRGSSSRLAEVCMDLSIPQGYLRPVPSSWFVLRSNLRTILQSI